MKPGELENRPIHRPGRASRGHYEVWYLTLADPATRTGAWIRYTLELPSPGAPGEPEAGIWFAFFDAAEPRSNVARQEFHPHSAWRSSDDPFRLTIAGSELGHGWARGRLGEAAWDLAWPVDQPAFFHYPRLMYRGPFPRTKVLSPCHGAPFRGRIEVGSRRIDLAGAPGQQSHLWGTKHAHRWAWAHAGAFDGAPGTVLEGLTGQVKIGSFVLPYLSLASLRHEGETHSFNHLSAILARNRGRIGPGPAWRLEGRSRGARLTVDLSCREEDLVLVEYRDPDGSRIHCRNTEVAGARVLLELPGRPPLRLEARQTAAFEIGQPAIE